ncbi:MAG: carboxypeptidase-like regulatory domain-containing protein [Blastocatellia bacterium]
MKYFGYTISFLILAVSLSIRVDGQICSAAPTIPTPANTVSASGTFNNSNITIFNSDEAGPDNPGNRTTADTYDDAWRTGSIAAGANFFSTPWAGGAAGTFLNGGTLFTISGITVTLSSVNMDTALETGSHLCFGTSLTSDPSLAGSGGTNLQDDSPRPAQLAGSGTYLEAVNTGDLTSRNALRFQFSSDVRSFGAWFGDLETRTDLFGRPAIIRLLDVNNNIIGQDILVGTSTADQPNDCDSTQTGRDPFGLSGCGSKTTRFIGFVDNDVTARVRTMLVIVGDADAGLTAGNPNEYNGSPEGASEHLSMIGATLGIAPTAANASVSGNVLTSSGFGIGRALVTATNPLTGETASTMTNIFGEFTIESLPTGNFYFISVHHKRWTFAEPTRAVQLEDNVFGIDFTALTQ